MSPSRMMIPMRELDLAGLCPVRALSESSEVESESGVCGPVADDLPAAPVYLWPPHLRL